MDWRLGAESNGLRARMYKIGCQGVCTILNPRRQPSEYNVRAWIASTGGRYGAWGDQASKGLYNIEDVYEDEDQDIDEDPNEDKDQDKDEE
ncbi:hypothetical protein BGX38DRAFT_1281680 [Terfezia claveryi]|nr:hypothetical protein BGX38DRAFT_1281680 [Terfezia claveryi]